MTYTVLKIAFFYVYVVIATLSLMSFDAGLALSALIIFFAPAAFFLLHERIAWSAVAGIAAFAVASAFLWEVIGYANGIWYALSSLDYRIFGLFPVEILFWNFGYILLMIAAYEYLFDDRHVHSLSWNNRTAALSVFTGAMILAAIAYVFWLKLAYIPYAYAWLLVATVLTVGIAALSTHNKSGLLFKKASYFALLMLIPNMCIEIIGIVNVNWVFANVNEYIAYFNFFGEVLPLEAIIFWLVIPAWVVMVYEMYLDDGH